MSVGIVVTRIKEIHNKMNVKTIVIESYLAPVNYSTLAFFLFYGYLQGCYYGAMLGDFFV